MTPEEFAFISQLIRNHSGLSLTPEKTYLLESRLLPIARSSGHGDLSALVQALQAKPDPAVIAVVIDAMTTNESMFFRDGKPFTQLRQVLLPRFKKTNAMTRRLRIWSAACSNGQEPYSIAISLLEEAALVGDFACEIVATDISPRVIAKAKSGIYSQFEVQRGLPITLLLKHFTQLPDNNWRISDRLRAMISFREQNLVSDFAALGQFDIIFCRNVLIYFDEETRKTVLERLSRALTRQGMLVLGSSESTLGLSDKFQMVGGEHGVYGLKG